MIWFFAVIGVVLILAVELKVSKRYLRLSLVLGIFLLSVGLVCFAYLNYEHEEVSLNNYSRLLYQITSDLYDLSESGQNQTLNIRLRKLKDELPQAMLDEGHMSYLMDQMQFINATNTPQDK